jgi:hypothetical protein
MHVAAQRHRLKGTCLCCVLCCCRDEFVGYSLCTLPNTPGCHHVSCPVWAAVEARRGFMQEMTSEQAGQSSKLQGPHTGTSSCST